MLSNHVGRFALAPSSLLCAGLLSACSTPPNAGPTTTEVALAPAIVPAPANQPTSRALIVAATEDASAPRDTAARGVTREPCASAGTLRSIHSDTPMHIDFVNHTSGWLDTYWISFDGRFVHYAELPPGERYRQQTYVTHPWIALDRDRQCRGVFVPHEAGVHVVEIGPD